MNGKPHVWFHSDEIYNCDCGDREWQIDLPHGYVWKNHAGPTIDLTDHQAVMSYASKLHDGHPDVRAIGDAR